MDNTRELAFYAAPGPMTDLSSCPPEVFEDLPDDPDGLMKVVRGCVTSDLMLTMVHGLPVPEGRESEGSIRPAADMVRRITELVPGPLVARREPQQRFIGNCRHFATLTCALFRRAGIPTRVRAGFAGYFEPDVWADHWIIEYRRDERWVRVDAQYSDRSFQQMGHTGATSEQLAQTMYCSGAEAWQRCRSGELDPNRFNMGGNNWGIGEIRGSVLYDLAALNQDEMLPWDCWARMEDAYKHQTGESYDAMLDDVANVVIGGDFDEIRRAYLQSDDLKVPAAMLPT
jgi:hypothetical protein